MTNKNDTMEWFEMRDRVYQYLKEEWAIGYYPNLEKLEATLRILSIRDKSFFYNVLAFLEEYYIILTHRCETGIERIFPHPNFELNELILKLFVDTVE
jgi:hypothetical protein